METLKAHAMFVLKIIPQNHKNLTETSSSASRFFFFLSKCRELPYWDLVISFSLTHMRKYQVVLFQKESFKVYLMLTNKISMRNSVLYLQYKLST